MSGPDVTKLGRLPSLNTGTKQVKQQDSGPPQPPILRFPRRMASEPLLGGPVSPCGGTKSSHTLTAGHLCFNFFNTSLSDYCVGFRCSEACSYYRQQSVSNTWLGVQDVCFWSTSFCSTTERDEVDRCYTMQPCIMVWCVMESLLLVTEIENISLGQLRRSILAFSDRCQRESPVFSFVFYAGHIITVISRT